MIDPTIAYLYLDGRPPRGSHLRRGMPASSFPTPDEVKRLLTVAYDDVDATGHQTAGHLVDGSADGLMYGELLPGGVSKALACMGATTGPSGNSVVLELGSGTGKVAFQAFLECTTASRVIAIELSTPRFALSVAAAERLAQAEPTRFSISITDERRRAELLETSTGRQLLMLEGDMLTVGAQFIAAAAFVFVQVALPANLYGDLQRLLQHAADGCVAMVLPDFTDSWELADGCCLHREQEGETFATSWAPEAGHRFHVMRCMRGTPPSITTVSAARIREVAAEEGHAL